MIYIENNCTDPAYNLAFEEFVFHNLCKDDTILLLWQNEPAVIIGRYQNTVEEVNTDYIEKNNVHVVRRMTGGGAVYHDLGNLNYSFIIPDVAAEIDFKTFSRPLVEALAELGITAEHTGRNDVTVDGKKISGNAQFYNKRGLLHHGTILFDSQLDAVKDALKVKEGKISSKGIKSVRSRVTNIRPYLSDDMDVDTFKKFLLKSFSKSGSLTEYVLSDEEKDAIKTLEKEKYGTWKWNHGSSPKSNIEKEGYFSGGYVKVMLDVDDGIIRNIKIYGDFFSAADITEAEKSLIGVRYTRENILDVFNNIKIEKYFHNIGAEELASLMY